MKKRIKPHSLCQLCSKPARYTSTGLCAVHYQIQYRQEVESSFRLGTCTCGHPAIIKGQCHDCYSTKYRANKSTKIKLEVFNAYGNECQCCGESNLDFLTIDHIHGRKQSGHDRYFIGSKLYKWLIKNNFPRDNFQLLCYNCNCAKGKLGYCPHTVAV